MRVYVTPIGCNFFCTTNSSWVLARERRQTFENSWKKFYIIFNEHPVDSEILSRTSILLLKVLICMTKLSWMMWCRVSVTDMKQDFNKCMVSPIGFKVNKFCDRSTRVKLSSFLEIMTNRRTKQQTDIRAYRKVILQIFALCKHSINGSKFNGYDS